MRFILSSLIITMLLSAPLAARASDADEMLALAAALHRQGDTEAAIAIWKKLARDGQIDAAYNLGLVYQHADGVAYDPKEAARWYHQAAEAGDKSAQFRLGHMYLQGEGVPRDEIIAHAWFTRHRREHLHHHHADALQRWREEARALIEARDQQETRHTTLAETQKTYERIIAATSAADENTLVAQQGETDR